MTNTGEHVVSDDSAALDYEAILAEYRHRQMLEHLTGPVVSLLLHVVLIIGGVFLLTGQPHGYVAEIEVMIIDEPLKELDPAVIEQLEDLQRDAQEMVHTVSKPDLSTEPVETPNTEHFNDQMAQTDDHLDFSSVLDFKPGSSPLRLPAALGGRTAAGRVQMMRQHGGSREVESAVLRALRWLKEHQKPDGSWSDSENLAMSGLALLTFLSHGETPDSKEFGVTVQKAIQYLVNAVMGQGRRVIRRGYTGGIVAYALAEAYGMTKLPMIKPSMEQTLTWIVEGQQPGGGWDYSYKHSERWDLSVAGWQIQAMKAGQVAGANVPGLDQALLKSVDFLKNLAYRNGRFGYSSPGSGSAAMTAAGTLCLQLLGEGRSPEARAALTTLEPMRMDWAHAAGHGNGTYWWYYHTQAMFHGGRSYWNPWNKHFSDIIVKAQFPDGHWESPAAKGKDAKPAPSYDPYMQTTLACLMLQVYYRYLPTYQTPKTLTTEASSVLDVLNDGLSIEIN